MPEYRQYSQVSIHIGISASLSLVSVAGGLTAPKCNCASHQQLQPRSAEYCTAVGTDVALLHLPTGRDSSILTTNNYYHFLHHVCSPVMAVCQHAVVFFRKKRKHLGVHVCSSSIIDGAHRPVTFCLSVV